MSENNGLTIANKKDLIERIMNVEYVPNLDLKTYDMNSVPSLPIANLASLGHAIQPLAEIITSLNAGGSGLYYVNTAGKTMFESGGGFIGSLKAANGAVGGGQAIMTPLAFNPATIAAACTVMAIEYKLNKITAGQKEISDFLIYKEQAKIKADINTLLEVLNDYKYNSNSEKYKNNKHILVQAIKNESEKSLLLLESLIEDKNNKKSGIHFNGKANEFMKISTNRLNDFQLSVYQYAFSSFLEVILLENFDEEYINSIVKSINAHKEKYEILSLKVKEKAKQLSETSIQIGIVKGSSKFVSGVGSLFEKTPLKKFHVGEKMIATGKKMNDDVDLKIDQKISLISESNANLTEPFEKTLEMVRKIHSNNNCIAFDSSNIYLDFDHE